MNMKRWMLALIICIPLASVAFGGVMIYFAFNTNDHDVLQDSAPLSKTSWQTQTEDAQP